MLGHRPPTWSPLATTVTITLVAGKLLLVEIQLPLPVMAHPSLTCQPLEWYMLRASYVTGAQTALEAVAVPVLVFVVVPVPVAVSVPVVVEVVVAVEVPVPVDVVVEVVVVVPVAVPVAVLTTVPTLVAVAVEVT